jgi:hypothetical protein
MEMLVQLQEKRLKLVEEAAEMAAFSDKSTPAAERGAFYAQKRPEIIARRTKAANCDTHCTGQIEPDIADELAISKCCIEIDSEDDEEYVA